MIRKDREAYNAYQREYQLRRYYKRRAEWIEYLGGKCVMCGATENLEFHHKDPTQKSFTTAKAGTWSEEKVKIELDKCELRCETHHKVQHATTHGKLGMHRHHGCRCDLCRAAFNAASRRGKRRRKSNGPVTGAAISPDS